MVENLGRVVLMVENLGRVHEWVSELYQSLKQKNLIQSAFCNLHKLVRHFFALCTL